MTAAKAWSYNRLGNLLASKGQTLRAAFRLLEDPTQYCFHPTMADWHAILGQIPPIHKYFEDTTPYHGISAARQATAAQGQVPPWRFGKD